MQTFTSSTRVLSSVAICGVAFAALAQTPPNTGKSLAASAGLFAYPAKGQKPDQQAKDEAECYNWSKQQSGYDPMQPPAAPTQTQPAQANAPAADGSRARGAVRGAAAGAAIGEIANNDAGEGAAIGAVAGAMAGGRRSRMAQSQAQQQAAQQAQASQAQAKAAQQELANAFKRGMTVCLEARGYTVK